MHHCSHPRLDGSQSLADDAFAVELIPQSMGDWDVGAGSHDRYAVVRGSFPVYARKCTQAVPSLRTWDCTVALCTDSSMTCLVVEIITGQLS